MNIYWFQFDATAERLTVIVDAMSMEEAKEILRSRRAELGIPREGGDLLEFVPDELGQDPRWSEQLRRLQRAPRLVPLNLRDVTERYGLICADPRDPQAFEAQRSEFLRRSAQ